MNENNRTDFITRVAESQTILNVGNYVSSTDASIGIFLGDIKEAEPRFGEGRDAYCYIRSTYTGRI